MEDTFELHLSAELEENFCDSKGWYPGAQLLHAGIKYHLTFYDPTRLQQECSDELQSKCCFFEENLVVAPMVRRAEIELAVRWLISSGQVSKLVPAK